MARGQTTQQRSSRPPRFKWYLPLLGIVAFVVIAAGGFLLAAHTEENDAFCASCHTEPESTFFTRTQAAPADLASAHHAKDTPTRCIDCHSAPGLTGRVNAVSLGAQDAIKFVLHTAHQPAPLTVPISDVTCLNCHQDTPNTSNFDHHFHRFLARWQARDANAATCVTCHTAHTTDGDLRINFVQPQRAEQVCQRCHDALGAGD